MILRIVLGRFPPGTDASTLVERREPLTRAARAVGGLDSLMLGVRAAGGTSASASGRTADVGAVVSVWRDVESMRRATADGDEDRFVTQRLELPFRVADTRHYEMIDRAFGALPPAAPAILRVVTVRARVNEEARLIEILRARQPRMIERGQVGSQVGRRVVAGGEVEAVVVGLWPDRTTLDAAAAGGTTIVDPGDLEEWADRISIEELDAIEMTPRLPQPSGPPIFILDADLRIVDITAAAAAVIGMPADDAVGRSVAELSYRPKAEQAGTFETLLAEGFVEGETAWRIPDVGAVRLRFVARRDIPIAGRHVVYVRRRLDPAPTRADLDAAVADAFGTGGPVRGTPATD